jgi:hypothetical protein
MSSKRNQFYTTTQWWTNFLEDYESLESKISDILAIILSYFFFDSSFTTAQLHNSAGS